MNILYSLHYIFIFLYCIHYIIFNSFYILIERDVAQWLKCGTLPMPLLALRFQIPLDAGFLEKYHVSPLSILGHCFDIVSLGKTLYLHMLYLTQV